MSSQTKWESVFDTNCLPEHKVGRSTFMSILMSSGGRISKLNNEEVLLSVGDYYFDGVNDVNMVNTSNSLYGKIIKINFINKKFKVYADGLRNIQGLVVTKMEFILQNMAPRVVMNLTLLNLIKIMDGLMLLLVSIMELNIGLLIKQTKIIQ